MGQIGIFIKEMRLFTRKYSKVKDFPANPTRKQKQRNISIFNNPEELLAQPGD